MAVISLPNYEPWVVARWAFRALLSEVIADLHQSQDVATVRQSLALDGLHFTMLSAEQAPRLAVALAASADRLRLRLEAVPSSDQRDAEFAEMLATLEMRLHDVYE